MRHTVAYPVVLTKETPKPCRERKGRLTKCSPLLDKGCIKMLPSVILLEVPRTKRLAPLYRLLLKLLLCCMREYRLFKEAKSF
jgi:hypothetical protein